MIDPLFIAEAAINGLLLGGVLALLALGLNLIFGVITDNDMERRPLTISERDFVSKAYGR